MVRFLIVLVGLGLVTPASAVTGDRMLRLIDRQSDTARAASDRPQFYSPRAKEQFLALDRTAPYGLPKAALPADAVDTISIIAIRIDFKYENPDEPRTTGRGAFDLRTKEQFIQQEGQGLDPAPHNRPYFEAHLRSLAQYWKVASGGKLQLVYEVWPREADSAYHLDSSMAYYGSQSPNFGLGAFFHDALQKAASVAADSLQFRDSAGRKKAVMLFHAGADRQTDLSFSFTPTPYDLYTGFATFDQNNWVFIDPDTSFIGPDPVITGRDTVVEGIIMPETMTQDNRVTVLNAVMAHEFGHQLGLVDLYNTGSSPFITQLGDFALMDNNGMNTAAFFDIYGVGVFGTVPIFPSAWSRAFLGFDEVVEYRQGTSIELAAVKMQTSQTKIAKIPISSTEYYLLENRRGDVDGQVAGLRQDNTTDVILWPVKIAEDSSLQAVPEYDLYLPGNAAGIAIWHVDEGVAAMDYFPFDGFQNNFDANTLQWDRNRRFIRLVEGDGRIDFGGNYYNGFGTPQKLFYAGNNASFASYTNPSTRSNDGGYTHIAVGNISPPGMIMTFDLAQDRMAANFPRRMSIPSRPGLAPVAADLNGDGQDEILMVSGRRILAVSADGRDFLDPDGLRDDLDTIYSPIIGGTAANPNIPRDFTTASMPVFAQTDSEITTPPIVARFGDTTLVLAGTTNGRVYAFLTEANDLGPDVYHARLFWKSLPFPMAVKTIITDEVDKVVYAVLADNYILAYSWDMTQQNSASQDSVSFVGACRCLGGMALLGERNGQSILYRAVFGPLHEMRNSFIPDTTIQYRVVIDDIGFYPPIATDFDHDGFDEVTLVSRTGHVVTYSFKPDGIVPYEPLTLQVGDTVAAAPTAGDFSGTGYPNLIVPGTNRLYGFDRQGQSATDFPVILDAGRPGQVVISSAIISDMTGDGSPDLAAVALDSIYYEKSAIIYYLDSLTSPDTIYIRTKDTVYHYYNYYSNLYLVSPGVVRIEGFPVPSGAHGILPSGDTVLGVATPLHMRVGPSGLLACSGGDGWLSAWEVGWTDGSGYWPMAGGTADGSRYLTLNQLGPETPLSDFLPPTRFYAYPNPGIGRSTTIRYYVSEPARVTMTIFDALGDKVKEISREVADGNRDDEVVWSLDDVASGVYHCRLEATSTISGKNAVAFKSIAVVK